MGWEDCGEDDQGRPIGYGVVATCDFPGCLEVIDRGLGYLCGPMHNPSEWGCGKYFCPKHQNAADHDCPHPLVGDERPECPPGQHQWVSRQCNAPSEPDEWCAHCKVCGMDYPDEED